MAEMLFDVLWPDDSLDRCYSPSTVISKHLRTDTPYVVPELLAQLRSGLLEASDRMDARSGYPCSGARDQLARLEAKSARFEAHQEVRVLGLYRRGGARPIDAVLADAQPRSMSQRVVELPVKDAPETASEPLRDTA